MAIVMLHAKNLLYELWVKAMSTTNHIPNRVTIRPGTKVTHYHLLEGRKPSVKYFHGFGSKGYILVDQERRCKMDPKSA